MSTKSLARSVVEGGRNGSYKSDIRTGHRSERTESRAYLNAVRTDPDGADDYDVPVEKNLGIWRGEQFAPDKLRPAMRFLEKQVGRPWAKIRSELFKRFDTRTTQGRHVLYDHILRQVLESPDHHLRDFYDYRVDAQGILQKNREERRYPKYDHHSFGDKERRELTSWLGPRKVGLRDSKLFWFVPTKNAYRISAVWVDWRQRVTGKYDNELLWAYVDAGGSPLLQPVTNNVVVPRFGWRQDRAMSSSEEGRFHALPRWVQAQILKQSPINTFGDHYWR